MDELELARLCGDAMWKDDKASQALGMEMEITGVGAATASMTIRDDMVNGLDVCHGGLVFALADTGYYGVKIHNQRDELVALFRGRSATKGEPILLA